MRRSSYRSSNNQLFAGIAGLVSLYPFACLIFWFMKTKTPDKQEFFGGEISMKPQQGFANWLYIHIVDPKMVILSLVIIIGCIYAHRKLN